MLDYSGNEIKLVPKVYKAPVGWNGYRERSYYEPCNYVGISNEKINQITKFVEKLNAIKCRNIDRNKYQIDIYTQPINMEGVKRLPWDGYKKAILASHTSYVSKNNFIIENHGIKISSRSLNSIKNGSLNVYGCHLSGKPKGELTHAQTMERIIQYLNTLDTSDKCDCEAPYKIQLVSGNFSKHFTGGQYYYD